MMKLKVGDKVRVISDSGEKTYTIFKANKIKAFAEEDEFGSIEEFKLMYDSEDNILPFKKWYCMDKIKRQLIKS